jgi:hypothetical protein
MKKRDRKKLTIHRETVLDLTAQRLTEAQGAGKGAVWSHPPQCDPACSSQTLSCTL